MKMYKKREYAKVFFFFFRKICYIPYKKKPRQQRVAKEDR